MATTVRLYWRIFAACAIPYGLGMGIYFALTRGLARGVAAGAMAGFLFGVVMSATLGTLAILKTRRAGPDALRVAQDRTVEVRGTREGVLERVRKALAQLPLARHVRVTRTGDVVEAKVGTSWRSWGEVVIARVADATPEGRLVHLTSRPRLRTTVVDYGKSHANLEAVANALRSQPSAS